SLTPSMLDRGARAASVTAAIGGSSRSSRTAGEAPPRGAGPRGGTRSPRLLLSLHRVRGVGQHLVDALRTRDHRAEVVVHDRVGGGEVRGAPAVHVRRGAEERLPTADRL